MSPYEPRPEGLNTDPAPPSVVAMLAASNWISVNERLPEQMEKVIVTAHSYNDPKYGRFVASSTYLDGEFLDVDGDELYCDHWMPIAAICLPTAPTAEVKNA